MIRRKSVVLVAHGDKVQEVKGRFSKTGRGLKDFSFSVLLKSTLSGKYYYACHGFLTPYQTQLAKDDPGISVVSIGTKSEIGQRLTRNKHFNRVLEIFSLERVTYVAPEDLSSLAESEER